jgi:hypothetical protein
VLILASSLVFAQDSSTPDCSAQGLAQAQQRLIESLSTLPVDDPAQFQQQLFAVSSSMMDLALACGYLPDDSQKNAQIRRTLAIAALPEIISALAVGTDTEAILAQLDEIAGDSFEGQLLYNGIDMGLDGTMLGCVGCHGGEAAPPTEGTWTRVDEIRLLDPALADYSIRRYLVESILHPQAYLVPDYANVMPPNYGSRLDLQQLANLVAFLESQDQLLPDQSD